MSRARSPGCGGLARIATSPWAPRPSVVSSRYLTKRSKSGPLQASVVSTLSGATDDMETIVAPPRRSAKPAGEVPLPQRLLAILVGAPAEDLVVAQLERPGHFLGARFAAVLFPPPAAPDQGDGAAAAPLQPFLVELLQLNRLLHAARLPRRPDPRRLSPPPQPATGMQLDLRVKHRHEGIQVALVEGADELADGIGHAAPSGAVALLVLLARPTPTGVVAADFVVLVLDHRLAPLAVAGGGGARGSDVRSGGAAGGDDFAQSRGLFLHRPAGVRERALFAAAVGGRDGARRFGLDFDL